MFNRLINEFNKGIFVFKWIGFTYQQLDIIFWVVSFLSIVTIILKVNFILVMSFYTLSFLLIVGMKLYKNHKYKSLEYKMSILAPLINSKKFAELLNQENENN